MRWKEKKKIMTKIEKLMRMGNKIGQQKERVNKTIWEICFYLGDVLLGDIISLRPELKQLS